MAEQRRVPIYVESIPLVEDRPSGVAHSLAGLVTELANNPECQKQYEVVLVAPKRALHKLGKWPGLENCRRVGLPLRMRILNGLMKFNLLPPMDLFLGKGVYLFGNFKNWPVSKHSLSFTYIHDICFALYPEFVSPKNQQFLMKNVPKFIKQTDYVITVSESSRREIIDFYQLEQQKVLSLYNGVNTDLYREYTAEEVAAAKSKYGVEGEYYFFLSNIEPRKNLKGLVDAFKTLPRDRTLVIVGAMGWLNEDVMDAIAKAKADGIRIIKPDTFVPDEDVARLLSGAIALVHPAFHEGFGMTPAEAMASKIPVVVADIPALREVVGEAGIFCNPHEVASIASAMKEVAALPADRRALLVGKGLDRVKQFTWKASAQKLAAFLNTGARNR